MKTIFTYIIAIAALLVSIFAYVHKEQQISFGATSNAGANALYEQSLAQPLGTTDANMYVTSGADVQGNLLPLNSYQCLSVDTGQPNFEAVCGTVTTTSTAGLTLLVSLRGLSTQTATTSNPSFIFTHRRGADVRITDFPTLTVLNNQLNGVQSIPSPIFYSSNFTTGYWATAASNTIVTLGQAAAISAAGCGAASESVSGCSQLATALQAASTTSTGSTGARLVIPASMGTDTPTFGCAVGYTGIAGAGCNVLADLTGHVWKSIVGNLSLQNLWSGINTFSASSTFNATTTIAASSTIGNALRLNNLNYSFPFSENASNTILETDGNGNLSWESQVSSSTVNFAQNLPSSVNATTTLATYVIPANTITTRKLVNIFASFISSGGSCAGVEIDFGSGSATTSMSFLPMGISGNPPAYGITQVTLIATTTNSELSTGISSLNATPTAGSQFGSLTKIGITSLTATSYIGFAANGTNCILNGYSVTVTSG